MSHGDGGSTANRKWDVCAVLATALALRISFPLFALAVAQPEPQFREPDTEGYLRVADEWLKTGRFAVGGEAEIVRTPGYPLLLMPGIAVGHVEAITIGLQSLLACLSVWLAYRTSLAVFGNRTIALTAAWLLACEPISIIYASKLLSETLFTTCVASACCLLASYASSRRWRELIAAAIVVSVAAYVRPIAYFLPLWVALALVVVGWRQVSDRKRLCLQALAFAGLSMALLVPWQVRNWLAVGYAGFSAISDVNLYYYEALPVLAEQQGIGPAQRNRARVEAGETDLSKYLRQHPEQADWPAARRYRFLRQQASEIIRTHPLAWMQLHFAGVVHTLTDSGRNAWLSFFGIPSANPEPARGTPTLWRRLTNAASQRPLVLAVHALLAAVLLVYLTLAAVGVGGALQNRAALLILAVAIYLLLLSGGDAGYHRFRLPLTPIICTFAARGYCSISGRLRLTYCVARKGS
ncbi:MAG TPA: glycosyltransferase family 39 protein [Pirellulales bacterium]|nr:glycosyltransferase family 39 protein [Pirellulales bacterium]